MKFRRIGAALAAIACLTMSAAPAWADNYDAKDGNGVHISFAAKLVAGLLHPFHIFEGMFAGTPTPVNMTNSGALDFTCVAGCATPGNTLGTQGTITAADSATSSTAGQGGISAVTGAPTASSFVTYAVSGASGGTLTISGTFVATSQIEASYDNGAHYTAASGLLRGSNLLTSSITGAGAFSVDLNGVTQLRVRATAYTSGTETVNFTYSPAPGLTKILNGVKPVDSGGGDATDTVNHAVKVNVVAGGGGGGAVTIANGADATEGDKTSDVTATTDIGTLSNNSLLRALVKKSLDTSAAPVKLDQTGTNNNVTVTSVTGTKAPGTAAASSLLTGCIYETSLPTLTTTQQAADHCDSSGRKQVTDTQVLAAMNSAVPAGTNIIGKVGIDQTTDGTTNAVHLVAGSAIAGKVGIDQTTDGTTNAVHLVAGTAVAGKFTTDQTTHGTTDQVASDLTKVGGTTMLVNTGATGAGSPRVTVAADSATVAGSASVPSGSNLIGHTDGAAAALAANTGNPNKVGCVFQTNTTAATTAQIQNVSCDAFGNTGKSFTPAMATQITAQSATTANTANAATLAAAASKFTYISGFACTAGGATAASLITVTVAGTITGSLTYTMAIPAGATLAAAPLIISFPNPVQGSAVNTAISVTIGAAGSGNTVEQCNAQGFQQ
jgi:hypothetical protein